MTDTTSGNVQGKPEPGQESETPAHLARRAGLFILFLICSLAVFLLGANYYKLFPTNGNLVYAACLSAFFLLAAFLFKRLGKRAGAATGHAANVTSSYRSYRSLWPIAYAFFVASMVNLVSDLFAGYYVEVLRFFGTTDSTTMGQGIAKLYDSLLVVITILVLTWLSGAKLDSVFIKKGNLNWKWGIGIGALVLVNYFTSVLIFYGTGYSPAALGGAILWGSVFAFSNSLLEELWVRGLFLKKLVPLIGVAGTVILSSLWFAAMHSLSVAYLPVLVIPIFVVNTFTLGLACGILMLKTDSIWGAFLIHAAADLFLFIATLAVR